MKKTISYSIVLLLFVWVLGSCGNGKDATEGADKKDKATTEKVEASDSDTEETAEEKVESHKGMYEPSELAKGWKQRTITVKGKNSDIVALFEAFHNAWPTDAGNRIMHQASPKQYPQANCMRKVPSSTARMAMWSRHGSKERIWARFRPACGTATTVINSLR